MASSSQPRRKLSTRRKGKEPSIPQQIQRGANLDGWISDEDIQLVFVRDFKERKIIPHKMLRINTFQNEGFTFQEHLKFQGLKHFVELGRGSSQDKRYYPDLVKTFYCNVFRNDLGIIQSKVKGVHVYLNDDIWLNVAKMPFGVGTNITLGYEGFNKLEVYLSFLKENHNENINLFKTGPMKMNERLLAYIISWVLCPRGSNHAQMTTEDVLILYGLVNGIMLDWPQIIGDNIIKARRYKNYSLPYGVFISKVLEYLGVDVSGEKALMVGSQNLIHSNVLHHMGFMQRGDRWVSKDDPQEEGDEEEEEEGVQPQQETQPMEEDQPPPQASQPQSDYYKMLEDMHNWNIERSIVMDQQHEYLRKSIEDIQETNTFFRRSFEDLNERVSSIERALREGSRRQGTQD